MSTTCFEFNEKDKINKNKHEKNSECGWIVDNETTDNIPVFEFRK